MKENIRKTSMFVLLSIAVIVVCILLFKQCSKTKSTGETSTDSSSPMTNVKKEIVENVKKNDLTEDMHASKSQKKRDKVIEQNLVDEKGIVSKATKKLGATNLQDKKIYKPVVHKEYLESVPKQFDEDLREDRKHKIKGVLADELKILTAKVNVLEEKVRALLEKMRVFSEEKEDRVLVEKLGVVEKQMDVNSTIALDTSKSDEVVFKYPTHVLAGGLSTYEKWTGYGLQSSYTYRINKYVSLGGQGNAFFKEGKYRGDRSLYMGLRANFHMFPLLVENSRFDMYAGGTAGIGRDDNVETFDTMWYLGVSYDFSKHWGVFVEAGNIGVMGLRLTF